MVSLFCVGLFVFLGLYFDTGANETVYPETYGLTDKFLPSYNHYFCQALQAESSGTGIPFNPSNATLYLLKVRPPLTDRDIFNFTDIAYSIDPTHDSDLGIRLNGDSTVSFEVCYEKIYPDDGNHYDAAFYLIKGDDIYYGEWFDDPGNSKVAVKSEQLTSQCQTVSYLVQEYDVYYFVFYSKSYNSRLNISYQFNRTVYHISADAIVQNCSFPLDGHSSCSLSLPILSSDYTALVSLNATPPVDYTDTADIKVSCQHHRRWLYAVIAVSAVVFTIICNVSLFVCIACIVCIAVRRQKKGYMPMEAVSSPPLINPTELEECGEDTTGVI